MKITFEKFFLQTAAAREKKAQSFTVANVLLFSYYNAGDSVVELDNFTSNKR